MNAFWSFAIPFSLPSFVKRIPADSLCRYFAQNDLFADADLPWNGDKHDLDQKILAILQDLRSEQREAVFVDWEEVQQLCDEVGQRALREIVTDVASFDQLEGVEARGLFVLRTDARGLARAFSIAYAARQYHGRAWSGYFVSRPEPPSDAQDALDRFETELREIFVGSDASGRKMKVECFERSGAGGSVYQYSIYVESLPQTNLEFVAEQPRRMTRKPVIEATLSYDPAAGTVSPFRSRTSYVLKTRRSALTGSG